MSASVWRYDARQTAQNPDLVPVFLEPEASPDSADHDTESSRP